MNNKEILKRARAVSLADNRKFNPDSKRSTDDLLTNCSICKRGVFKQHEYKWSKIGIVHTECLDENEQKALSD